MKGKQLSENAGYDYLRAAAHGFIPADVARIYRRPQCRFISDRSPRFVAWKYSPQLRGETIDLNKKIHHVNISAFEYSMLHISCSGYFT